MKKCTHTFETDVKKTGDIASGILSDLVGREDLTLPDLIAVVLNIQSMFDEFLKQEGITINNVKKVYQ